MPAPSASIVPLLERLNGTTNLPDRLSLLENIVRTLLPDDPAEALGYVDLTLHAATEMNRDEIRAWCHAVRGECQGRLDQRLDAYESWHHAWILYQDLDFNDEAASAALETGRCALTVNDFHGAVEAFERSAELYQKTETSNGAVAAHKGLGDLYDRLGDDERALEHYLTALRFAEMETESTALGILLSDVGLLYAKREEYVRALASLNRALDQFRSHGARRLEVRALANLANLHAEQGATDQALDCGLRALAIYETLGDKPSLAATLLNLANVYRIGGNMDAALDARKKAYSLFGELGDDAGRCSALLGIGELYTVGGHHHEAAFFLEEALRLAQGIGAKDLEERCHEALASTLGEVGDSIRAFRHLREHVKLYKDRASEEKRRGLAEMQARFDLERAEKEREIWRLKSLQLEKTVEQKQAEVASMALQLVEKSKFMEEIWRAIAEVERDVRQEARPLVQEVGEKIRRRLRTEDDWAQFEEQFENVNHAFVRNLAQCCPELSATEIKVCTLLRTGLSTGQIAELMHLEVRSVETYRGRIRKKLGLVKKQNLIAYLTAI